MYVWNIDDLIDYIDMYVENEKQANKKSGISEKTYTNKNLDEC